MWPRKAPEATSPTPGARTVLVILDSKGRPQRELPVDLSELQSQGERMGGDPVKQMTGLALAMITNGGYALQSGAERDLEEALGAAVLKGSNPREIRLKGTEMQKRPIKTTPSQARDGAALNGRPWPKDLFEDRLAYPSEEARHRLSRLVGLDFQKEALIKEATLLVRPEQLKKWAQQHHRGAGAKLLDDFARGAPLFIFAGDVGTGKTALAESFADAVARSIGEPALLYRLSMQTRGSGIVGQMSEQITKAFAFVETEARATDTITVLLLDEADSLAASRETPQMHHEDRAGVNAVIQGVDRLRQPDVPAVVVFCTNRGSALDPAIRRRAMHYLEFERPNATQREALLRERLDGFAIAPHELARLVDLTGPRSPGASGYTYSDLTDRLLRTAVLRAFPEAALTGALLCQVAEDLTPTPAFGGPAPEGAR